MEGRSRANVFPTQASQEWKVPKVPESPQNSVAEAEPSGNAVTPGRTAPGRQTHFCVIQVPRGATFTTCPSSCVFQAEVCAGTVAEVIQSVVNGADGCVFCFGHAKLGE